MVSVGVITAPIIAPGPPEGKDMTHLHRRINAYGAAAARLRRRGRRGGQLHARRRARARRPAGRQRAGPPARGRGRPDAVRPRPRSGDAHRRGRGGPAARSRAPGRGPPPAAGGAALPLARAALAAAAGVRAAADELAGLIRGRVAVGVVPSVGHRLAGVLAAFHAEHPGADITLAEDTSDALTAGVRAGRLDFALAGIAGDVPGGLAAQTVTDERLVAAVAPGHRLAARRTVTLRALRDEALIALPPGTGGRAGAARGLARGARSPPAGARRASAAARASASRRGSRSRPAIRWS